MKALMKTRLLLLEGSENIKIRQVIKPKGSKDLLFRGGNLLKMIFVITVITKGTSVGIVPGTIYLDVIKTLIR